MGVACSPPGRAYIFHVRKNELLIKQNISNGQATLSVKERASEKLYWLEVMGMSQSV